MTLYLTNKIDLTFEQNVLKYSVLIENTICSFSVSVLTSSRNCKYFLPINIGFFSLWLAVLLAQSPCLYNIIIKNFFFYRKEFRCLGLKKNLNIKYWSVASQMLASLHLSILLESISWLKVKSLLVCFGRNLIT